MLRPYGIGAGIGIGRNMLRPYGIGGGHRDRPQHAPPLHIFLSPHTTESADGI